MDQTQLFHATVRTIRLRLKAQHREAGSLSESSLFTKSYKPTHTDFSVKAKDVVSHFTYEKNSDYW